MVQMIPKILHLYWGRNNPLSYIRYLTIKSFVRYNPDWKIRIGYPSVSVHENFKWKEQQNFQYKGKDYFEDVDKFDNVEIVKVSFEEHPYLKTEVHRSDIYRWEIIRDMGGVWVDFDVIFIKKMFPVHQYDKFCIVRNNDHYPVGFFGAPVGDRTIIDILRKAKDNLNPDKEGHHNYHIGGGSVGYQAAGIFAIGYEVIPEAIHWSPNSVYPFAWNGLTPMLYDKQWQLPNSCIGIHWFGGAVDTKEFEGFVKPDCEFMEDRHFHRILKELI